MTEARTKYFTLEQETWQRTLDYIQQQNVTLKSSLAQISSSPISRDMLDKLEHFQQQFLEKDTLIALLRRDIAQQLQQWDAAKTAEARIAILRKQEKLRSDMERMEKDFSSLKFAFNQHMAGAL